MVLVEEGYGKGLYDRTTVETKQNRRQKSTDSGTDQRVIIFTHCFITKKKKKKKETGNIQITQ